MKNVPTKRILVKASEHLYARCIPVKRTYVEMHKCIYCESLIPVSWADPECPNCEGEIAHMRNTIPWNAETIAYEFELEGSMHQGIKHQEPLSEEAEKELEELLNFL